MAQEQLAADPDYVLERGRRGPGSGTAMTSEVVIRPARPEDADAIAEVHVASYEDTYRGLIPDEVIDERPIELRRRVWRERLARDRGEREFVLAAELEGEVAGFASGRPRWENLYVDPDRMQRGLGRQLRDAVLRSARERGFSEAVLFLVDGNDRAGRFFHSLGWRADGGQRSSNGVRQVRLRQSVWQKSG